MKYPILFFFMIWFAGVGYTQNKSFKTFRDYLLPVSNRDSLEKTGGNINPISSQYLHLLIAIELRKQNAYDKVNKEKVKQIIQHASKQKSQLGLAMAYYILGREYTIDQDDSLSYIYLTRAEKIFTAGNDTTGIIHCSKLLRSHTRRVDKNLPKFYFDKVVALGQHSKYPIDNYMYYLLIMACDPYFEPQPTESQIAQTLNKTLKMIDTNPHFEYIRANVYKNIQEGYLRKKRHDKVLEFALKVMHHTNKKIDFMDYQYLGNAYLSVKKYDQAIAALEEAAKRIKIERPMALMRRRNIYFFLKKAYYEAGNLKASIRTDETYDSLVSVIRDNDRSVALFHLREKYSFADKEAELKRLALEKEIADSQKSLLFGGLIMTLVLVGIVLFFTIRLRKTNVELLHLQQARDKFYTIIAHDLRSPINSLNDMGVLLHHLIQEGKKQELDKVIQQIENMRQKTQLLLNNLFEWGKSQYFTPDVEEARQPTDVVPLLRELYQTYLPFAEAKKIDMVAELPQRSVLSVAPGGLLMTVRNLLDNALKNTPAGGKIKIEMTESSADSPAQSSTKLTIADTGKGIAPDQLHYLQQVFAGKIKPEVGIHGLGLGMILIHHFVQKQKAALTIESEVGKGTCFKLILEA
jgi:signal transduction histidine kinase